MSLVAPRALIGAFAVALLSAAAPLGAQTSSTPVTPTPAAPAAPQPEHPAAFAARRRPTPATMPSSNVTVSAS